MNGHVNWVVRGRRAEGVVPVSVSIERESKREREREKKADTYLLRRQMDGEAADDGDFQFDPLGAGGVVRVADVSTGVLDPGRLQHQHAGARMDPLRVEDHRRARDGLAEPEVRGRRYALGDAGQHDRLAGANRPGIHSLVESRRRRIAMLWCGEKEEEKHQVRKLIL